MGSLFWQINDCWPVASWSSTDYYRRWKAQQYFAKQAFDQVLVSPVLEHGNITVYIVNDGLTARSMMLELKVLDFSGKVIAEINLPVTVKPNGSEVYFKGELKQMLHDNPSGKALLTTTVLENHRVIARNILYFLPVKELTLPVPKINKTLQLENGEFVLELSSDKLVKNLYLSLSQGNGFFSDNYFDMLPGEKVTVHYKPEDNPLTLEEFQKELQLMQMAEIY